LIPTGMLEDSAAEIIAPSAMMIPKANIVPATRVMNVIVRMVQAPFAVNGSQLQTLARTECRRWDGAVSD
jgi:hypothetical protein